MPVGRCADATVAAASVALVYVVASHNMQKLFSMSAPAVSYLIDERRVSVNKSKKLGEGSFGVVYLATLNEVLSVVAKVQSLLGLTKLQHGILN